MKFCSRQTPHGRMQTAIPYGCNDFGGGHYGTVFLIKGNENLYDDQKIDLSHFSVQQIGIYRYETCDDLEKAVPFIEIKK